MRRASSEISCVEYFVKRDAAVARDDVLRLYLLNDERAGDDGELTANPFIM
jgi:hypothetical protein